MHDQDQDKTEKASPYKLQEARKRGQVSKSTDIGSVVMLVTFTVVFLATARNMALAIEQTFLVLFAAPATLTFNERNLLPWLADVTEPLAIAMSPLLIALVLAALFGTLIQTGFVFSSHPLKPDFNRLNPAQGMKKFFNLRILFELFKVCLKLALVGIALYSGSRFLLPEIQQLMLLLPAALPERISALFAKSMFTLVIIFVAVALLDLLFSRFEFARQMRMSRRELKDEHKRRDGDPEIKSKRRQMQQEMRKRATAVKRVAEADVVLVNPTHLAVALRYRPQAMRAPEVRAMGMGRIAEAMRREARRHNVPIVRNRLLARALYRQCRIDQPVPDDCFDALAPVYRWLMSQPGCKAVHT